MSVALEAPFPVPRSLATAMAALGPVAVGGILAARAGDASPMLAAPAIVFGVVAATGPALYIAMAAATAAIAGAGYLGLRRLAAELRPPGRTGASAGPSVGASTGPCAGASTGPSAGASAGPSAGVSVGPSAGPSAEVSIGPSLLGGIVFLTWAVATAAIAGRLWWDLAVEVVSW
jgi:hypothetical protein